MREQMHLAKVMAAETFGTFLLVLFGCGVVHTAVLMDAQVGLWQIAIVWGVAIMIAIFVVDSISGAHINPAITIAFACWGKHPWSRVIPYMIAQVLGAILAASILYVLFSGFLAAKESEKNVVRGEPGSIVTAMCYGEYFPNPGGLATRPGPFNAADHAELKSRFTHGQALLTEFLGTFILALVVFAVTDKSNASRPMANLAPVFIGLTVSALISVLAPLTQGCFNPARDFGPRLFAYSAGWGSVAIPGMSEPGWLTVYILAPIAGAIAGGGFYKKGTGAFNGIEKAPVTALAVAMVLSLNAFPAVAQDRGPFVLDPEVDYWATRSNPVTYDVDFSVVVTPPYHTKVLKVWLPIPPSDAAQEVTNSTLSTFPMEVEPLIGTESLYSNTFAYFEFHSPQGGQIIRHQFQVKTHELNWNLDPAKLVPVDAWPESFAKYQRSESQAVVVDQRFRNLLDEIVPQKTLASRDFGSVMNWVQANFKYDHHDASLSASSEHGLSKRRGHCSDYHGFCASMGRALGVPTRVTYGIAPFPKNSPSHCKLEAYLAPYGWVSFDVSETQKLIRSIKESVELSDEDKQQLIEEAQTRMERGYRDNTWFLQTRGTDYDLVPKATKRVAVVRTAYIEADGVALAEPDPADSSQTQFSWMTVHKYSSDKEVTYPFTLKKGTGALNREKKAPVPFLKVCDE